MYYNYLNYNTVKPLSYFNSYIWEDAHLKTLTRMEVSLLSFPKTFGVELNYNLGIQSSNSEITTQIMSSYVTHSLKTCIISHTLSLEIFQQILK